jgi:hypothetical protein
MLDNQNTAEPQSPRRRWFQFRLRTMLIGVMVLCVVPGGYVICQRKIVQDRKSMLETGDEKPFVDADSATSAQDQIPLIRRWLGDRAIRSIRLKSDDYDANVERHRAAFPEAQISFQGKPPPRPW